MMMVVELLVGCVGYCKLLTINGYKWICMTVVTVLESWKCGVGGWEVGDGVCEELGDDDGW